MRKKTNALLEIIHSYRQHEYVDWKYAKLSDLVRTPPKIKSTKTRLAYRFTTRSLPELTEIYNDFYMGGKKIIPDDIDIDPLTLAVWYMDDGSRCGEDIYFNTQKFDLRDQLKLVAILMVQFGIKSTLNRDKTYLRIRIMKESVWRLMRLIEPYVLPQFRRKILVMTP